MSKMRNKPYEVVDKESGVKKTVWEHRSPASALFIFGKDSVGNWRVLAERRGQGCPDKQGMMVCPCGYLDYDEDLIDCGLRECHEETGVRIMYDLVHHYKLTDKPDENLQNVNSINYAIVKNPLAYPITQKYNEPNEVDLIRWVSIDTVDDHLWAFGHDNIIHELFEMRINIPWWKKLILNLYEKFLSPESYESKNK